MSETVMMSEESHAPSLSPELVENLREFYGDLSPEELLQVQVMKGCRVGSLSFP